MPRSTPHKRYGLLAIAATVAIVVSFFIATRSTLDRREQTVRDHRIATLADYRACLRINKLNRLIQEQLRVSLRGLPTIAYYKRHPAELHRVQHQTANEIRAFAPETCKEAA